MIKSDPTKQIIIMAQSATRLAVEVAISQGKTDDFKFIGNTAHKLMEIELKLAGKHIPEFKTIQNNSREQDLQLILKSIKDKPSLIAAWGQLTEDEQIKYKEHFDKLEKKYK